VNAESAGGHNKQWAIGHLVIAIASEDSWRLLDEQETSDVSILHEPLPMKPLMPKGLGKGGDGGGVDRG
jgi:hypothetical protein